MKLIFYKSSARWGRAQHPTQDTDPAAGGNHKAIEEIARSSPNGSAANAHQILQVEWHVFFSYLCPIFRRKKKQPCSYQPHAQIGSGKFHGRIDRRAQQHRHRRHIIGLSVLFRRSVPNSIRSVSNHFPFSHPSPLLPFNSSVLLFFFSFFFLSPLITVEQRSSRTGATIPRCHQHERSDAENALLPQHPQRSSTVHTAGKCRKTFTLFAFAPWDYSKDR